MRHKEYLEAVSLSSTSSYSAPLTRRYARRRVRYAVVFALVLCGALSYTLYHKVGFLDFHMSPGAKLDSLLVSSVWSFAKLVVLSVGTAVLSVGLLYRRDGGWGLSRQQGERQRIAK